MVTDVFPALALGLGKGDKTVMQEPPKDPKAAIVSNKDWIAVVIYALTMTMAVIIAIMYCKYTITTDHRVENNVAFITLAFAQLFHVFNMASTNSKLLVNEITKNKFVWLAIVICTGLMLLVYMLPQTRIALGLVVLPAKIWMVAIVASLLPLALVQIYKVVKNLIDSNSKRM